ncbi:MAG TPA: LPS assembly protein LptD, partial [Terriglobales bacterium]|nr:LPS assembly protein LptD [Terriglobales bacterium]
MTFRKRIFITTAWLCHLFLAPLWLTSQLHAQTIGIDAAVAPAATSAARAGEPITFRGEKQEKQGDIYKLIGDAEIDFRNYVFKADEITYNDATGEATATGHIIFDGGPHDEHITATNGTYNVNTDSGKFYNVVGSTGAKLRGRAVVLTSSNPFLFTGKEVEKQGRDKIIVRSGRVTSCKLPNPKWTFNASEVVVVPGENAKIYNSTFHLFGIPVFYFPFVEHPVERLPRQTGFLLPHIGNSTAKGFILGEGFFWAINRSADATLGAEYYSKRGWAQRGEFRMRPNDSSYINFSYFGVVDRGLATTTTQFVPGVGQVTVPARQKQGGEEAQLNAQAQLPYGFRGVASIDYLSQFVFRAVFAERFTEAINSETKSTAFASRNQDGYSFNVMSSRYQNFQSTTSGDVITIVHAPGAEVSSAERQYGESPIHWSFNTALEALSRREPQFVTGNAVGRFELAPSVSLPLHWKGWSFRPELDLHETYYSERLLPGGAGIGTPASEGINRRAVEATVDVRPPSLAKIFDHTILKHQVKHVIEPRFKYRIVSGVDNFQNIIRFDYRDVLSDTNEIEYGLVQRLYTRQKLKAGCEEAESETEGSAVAVKPGCETPPARESVSWEVAQKYFFD